MSCTDMVRVCRQFDHITPPHGERGESVRNDPLSAEVRPGAAFKGKLAKPGGRVAPGTLVGARFAHQRAGKT